MLCFSWDENGSHMLNKGTTTLPKKSIKLKHLKLMFELLQMM